MICPWSSPNIRFVFSAVYRHSIPATIKYNVYTAEILLLKQRLMDPLFKLYFQHALKISYTSTLNVVLCLFLKNLKKLDLS